MSSVVSAAEELLLSIGAVVGSLSLSGVPQPWLALVRSRYGAFTMPPAPSAARTFAIELRAESVKRAVPAVTVGSAVPLPGPPLAVTVTDKTIRLERWDFRVRLTAQSGDGGTRWTGSGTCEMNPYALDSLLRVLWSIFLPLEGGALIHSCGLRHEEVAVVLPGQSGAGKTTLARKATNADKGSSMRPFLKGGDSLFIQAAGQSEINVGDIVLSWRPGKTPHDDTLTCHRMVARVPATGRHPSRYLAKSDALSRVEAVEDGRHAEILGSVSAISPDGHVGPIPGRTDHLTRLFGSLVTMPIPRIAGR